MIQKNNNYYKTSLEIVKEFIQTITIVDDKAQFTPKESDSFFDAGRIIKQFAEDGKVCSVFKFTEKEDVNKIAKIARKSDITILDWKIELSETIISSEEDDLEENVVHSKGYYTLEILKQIISQEDNSLKLIAIYTDEPAFGRIVDEIKKELKTLNISIGDDENKFSFYCNNSKVTVLGKEELKGKTTYSKDIAERSYNYEELPEAIYEEFVNFTHGVVAGIFLKTIASIRENTFLLLNTFQRDVDAAFITHKGLLPIPDDAHDHIIELIGSEIKCVINGGLSNDFTNSLIENFIDILDENHFLEYKDQNRKNKKFSKEEFKSFLNGNTYQMTSSKKALPDDLTKSIVRANDSNQSQVEVTAHQSNIKFAKLTTLKNRYLKFPKPILTLGVIIKGTNNEYWICIQPKCDSVRISENERAFLFLSLSKTDKGEIIYNPDTRFKVEYNIKRSKQFMFKPTINEMVVVVKEEESERWFFEDSDKRHFEYLCELKNDFAQSIANNFAAQISRVAVNHSEWLRLNANR
jgi:hypothetical protein